MVNTEDVVFFKGQRDVKEALQEGLSICFNVCESVSSSDRSVSRICVDKKDRGGCVDELNGNFSDFCSVLIPVQLNQILPTVLCSGLLALCCPLAVACGVTLGKQSLPC